MQEEMILIDVHQMKRELKEQIRMLSSGSLQALHHELGESADSLGASLSHFREKEDILYDHYQALLARLEDAISVCELIEEYQLAYQRIQNFLKRKHVLEESSLRMKKMLYEEVKRVRPDGSSYIATVKNESVQTQMQANSLSMQAIDFDVRNLEEVMKSIELGLKKVVEGELA